VGGNQELYPGSFGVFSLDFENMNDWTSGYVSDIDYTYGYYKELNPLNAKLSFTNAGLKFPKVVTACELGFGQGLSTSIHAAASSVQWWGTDFNPSQAAFAQNLTANNSNKPHLFDQSFEEFCKRPDIPDFDLIGLHGIWSWISDENRNIITEFVRKKLKVGGVLYISYNTLPGWANFAPMRHLMTRHAEILGAEGKGIVNRIDGAIEFATKLLETEPRYAKVNPAIAGRIEQITKLNRHYLAHEYFNKDWHPMHFGTMADWLSPAKVQYACSANLLDEIDTINLTPTQKAFLDEIPDPNFRQSTWDFMTNQQFRRDYWIKGAQKLSPIQKIEALDELPFVMVATKESFDFKIAGSLGEATLEEETYKPLVELLADCKPRTAKEVFSALSGINKNKLYEALLVLTGKGTVSSAQEVTSKIKASSKELNQEILDKARGSDDISNVASPVIAGGVSLDKISQLFVRAIYQGKSKEHDWAQHALVCFNSLGQRMVTNGVTLQTEEENVNRLTELAVKFKQERLHQLKALGVI